MSNYALAKRLECHPSTIANWIGGTTPQRSKLIQVADVFGVSVEYLTGETDEREIKKEPSPVQGGLTSQQLELIALVAQLSDEDAAVLAAAAKAQIASHKAPGDQ